MRACFNSSGLWKSILSLSSSVAGQLVLKDYIITTYPQGLDNDGVFSDMVWDLEFQQDLDSSELLSLANIWQAN